MISLWIVIGLIISTFCVSTLAAFFSVVGLAALFSGAWMAVCAMAGALELSKFVLAAYLHQQWDSANKILRSYLTFAILVLSLITSMGIFGFLSDAYQSASNAIETENVKLHAEKKKQSSYEAEIARLTRSVDEIPDTRITKKLKARAAAEPMILELNKKIEESSRLSSTIDLKVLEIKKKVGPLIYISKAFNISIDSAVKYLIFVFVLVFDPLAICLVIATTQALDSRRRFKQNFQKGEAQQIKKAEPFSEGAQMSQPATETKTVYFETTAPPQLSPEQVGPVVETVQVPLQSVEGHAAQPPVKVPQFPEDHMIQMSYSEETESTESSNDSTSVTKPKVG